MFDDWFEHNSQAIWWLSFCGKCSVFFGLSIQMSFISEPWTMSHPKHTFHYHTTDILGGAANQMNNLKNIAGMDLCVEWNDDDDRQKHIRNEHKLSLLFGMLLIANVLTLNAAVLFFYYLSIGIALNLKQHRIAMSSHKYFELIW